MTRTSIFDEQVQDVIRCACGNVRMAARAVTQEYDDAMRGLGLGANQFTLLAVAQMLGPITIQALADAVVMDRTTLARNLKPLQKQGLVAVQPGDHDRRERVISLTAEGRHKLKRALPRWRRAQEHLVDALGERRFERFLDDLRHLLVTVRKT